MKIAVVGGGSTYTPELIDGFARLAGQVTITEIVLVDPDEHRLGVVGQETTGAGGFAKVLRTVPVVLQIAERARARAADDAWLIDFTNPVGIVTRALLDAGHRAIGLCNVAIGFQRIFAGMLGVAPERIGLEHVGLNHLTWERAVLLDGTDVLPDLIATR